MNRRAAARVVADRVMRAAVGSVRAPVIPPPRDLRPLTDLAIVNGVDGYVAAALAEHATTVPDRLMQRRRMRAMTHLRITDDAGALDRVLTDAGVDYMVFKGPDIAGLHPSAALRPYADLDVLVEPRRFADALAAIEDAGGVAPPDLWTIARADGWAQYPVVLPSGTVVDLHWHPANDPGLRAALSVDVAQVLGQADDAAAFRRPDPVTRLLLLCLHAVSTGGHRLIWLKDAHLAAVDLAGRHQVGQLPARARETGTGTLTATFMALVMRELGDIDLPLPTAGRSWRNLVTLTRRLSPSPHHGYERSSALRLLLRATRHDTLGSLRALARRTWAVAGGHAGTTGQAPPFLPESRQRYLAGLT